MTATLNGNSTGNGHRPGLRSLTIQAVAPPATAPGQPELEAANPARAVRPTATHPFAWAMPASWLVWVVAAFIALSGAIAAESREAALGIIGLYAATGFAWSVQAWRFRRGGASFELAYGTAGLIGVAAIGCAAILAGTALTPALLALPLAVGVLTLAAGSSSISEAGVATALSSCLVLALRSTIGLDEPIASSSLLIGGSAALSIGAFVFARQLRGVDIDYSHRARSRRARRAQRSAGSSLRPEIVEQLRAADNPLETVRLITAELSAVVQPSYVAVSEVVPDTDILVPLAEDAALDVDIDLLRAALARQSRDALSRSEVRVLMAGGGDYGAIMCRRAGMEAIVVMPLRRLNRTVGVLHMAWASLAQPDVVERAVETATALAEWITPDLAIASIASEIERGYVGAMSSVSASLESRDGHLNGHSRRVAKNALEIAELLGLGEHDQRQLVFAAEIHELGRVGVSDHILEKPGALTDEEWAQVKMIPTLGAEIVEPVSFFGDVREAILHLRERWDGKGYPQGIPGEHIPLLARILAVADAYDAMTSPRSYRAAMSQPDALRQLWRERGSRFDPHIVEVFVEHRGRETSATQ